MHPKKTVVDIRSINFKKVSDSAGRLFKKMIEAGR